MAIPEGLDLFAYEKNLWMQGFQTIAGIDEAGRGPLAGPVVSACVLIDSRIHIDGVYDSKALSYRAREFLYDLIIANALSYGIGVVDHTTIDQINIYQAAKLSMRLAYQNLQQKPDFVLVDAMPLKLDSPSESIIKGDQKSFAVAAASIVAKVYRDRLMDHLHQEFPVYGWNKNRGYPTKAHRQAIQEYGPSPYHRKTFRVTPNQSTVRVLDKLLKPGQ